MTPQELKNSILQLAIQGKLVEQRPEEGTAEELYKQIQAEKQALIKAGKIKKEKPLPELTEDEIPFEIPESWKWVRFGECGSLKSGFAFKSAEYTTSGIQVVRISDLAENEISCKDVVYYAENDSLTPYLISMNSFLICMTGSIGKMAWVKDDVPRYLNQRVGLFEPLTSIDTAYLWWFLHNGLVLYIWERAKTSTNGNIKNSDITELVCPLPPLAEQKRIVAKIEELLPLIERYEKAWSRLENFNKRFPGDMQKSILQMAIQGKLVEQRPEEGTGEELYRQIQAEKQALIKAGKIKKEKPLPEITEEEIPFEIPESWKWCYVGDLFQHNTGKALNSSDKSGTPMTYITTSNLYWNRFELEKLKEMPFTESEVEKCTVQKGDLLVCEGGDYGRSAIWPYDYPMRIQNHIHRLRAYGAVSVRYFYYCFYLYKNAGMIAGKGIAIQGLSSNALHSLKMPLPPLAEQKRIVAKLEQLLPLCEKLK